MKRLRRIAITATCLSAFSLFVAFNTGLGSATVWPLWSSSLFCRVYCPVHEWGFAVSGSEVDVWWCSPLGFPDFCIYCDWLLVGVLDEVEIGPGTDSPDEPPTSAYLTLVDNFRCRHSSSFCSITFSRAVCSEVSGVFLQRRRMSLNM